MPQQTLIVEKINDTAYSVNYSTAPPAEVYALTALALILLFLALIYIYRKDAHLRKERQQELKRLNDVLEKLEKKLGDTDG